ncbi:MAG TPA: carboxyl transferase domain-containing protein, partial [Solirubrobacteraceae bacterium]|nr:carboxyl transferase domain-containing protein [Solirubrobacteraceae bacterium]
MSAVLHLVPDTSVGLAQARVELLCDAGTFRPVRSAVGDGVVAGHGRVHGRAVWCWAQDGTYRGGSLGAAGGETIVRTIRSAQSAGAPVVGFPHSGGARLQEGLGALTAYAAIFRAQSLADVPQVSVVGGACAGGAAYSPALGDITVMAGPGARMFLTGPKVVERVTRERVTAEELGGPKVHAANGVAHLRAADDVEAADRVRDLLAHLPSVRGGALPLAPPDAAGLRDPSAPVPAEHRLVYDVRDVARGLLDGGRLLELAPRWARSMVVGLGRIDGRPVGLIANQ